MRQASVMKIKIYRDEGDERDGDYPRIHEAKITHTITKRSWHMLLRF